MNLIKNDLLKLFKCLLETESVFFVFCNELKIKILPYILGIEIWI